jgi:protocatechuate 3,4-dioxygenase beta subunit
MRLWIHGLVALIACSANAAFAEPICKPTSAIATHNYPGGASIPSTNNLIQPTGKAVAVAGQQLIIYGRVVDITCAPVREAVVELWQNSPTGRWLLAGDADLASASPVFAGAGRTYTDSDGNFTFITAFPAPLGNNAPYVSLRISGQGFKDISTALYFSDDARNARDAKYSKLASNMRSDTTIAMQQGDDDTLVGTIQLVIPSKAPFRAY